MVNFKYFIKEIKTLYRVFGPRAFYLAECPSLLCIYVFATRFFRSKSNYLDRNQSCETKHMIEGGRGKGGGRGGRGRDCLVVADCAGKHSIHVILPKITEI